MIPDLIINYGIVIRILLILLNSILTILLINQYLKFKMQILFLLILISVLSAGSYIYQIYMLIFNPYELGQSILEGDVFVGILISFITLIYLDIYESSRLNALRTSFATSLATLATVVSIPGVKISLLNQNIILDLIISYSQAIFFTYIVIIGIKITMNMKKFASPTQKRLINFIELFIITGFGGPTVVYTIIYTGLAKLTIYQYNLFQLFLLFNVPATFIFISNIFFYFGYVKPNSPSAIQPQRIDRFILITNQGTPVFTYDVDKEVEGLDDTLFSGAITAISAVLKESTNIVGDIKSIEIGNLYLIIYKFGELSGILFSYLQTKYLIVSLKDLMTNILNDFQNKTNFYSISVEVEKSIETKVKSTFGI